MADTAAWHLLKNAVLLSLTLILLPLNTTFILAVDLWNRISGKTTIQTPKSRKTVLVTGVSMAKGLAIARQFHRSGHRVVGADFHSLSLGHVSVAIHSYHRLPSPSASHGEDDSYVQGILALVRREGVDLWIAASDVNAAMHDAVAKEVVERDTAAEVIQLGPKHIQMLHEKDAFMEHTKKIGLPIPETEIVEDRDGIVNFLKKRECLSSKPRGKQYLIKPIGVDDGARMDMPLLPLPSEAATMERIKAIPFRSTTHRRYYIIQEYISGPEYCTHALIIRGRVRAFVACPSADILMHYRALPADSPLSRAMLEFTQKQAEAEGNGFTGHVSFDFLIRGDEVNEKDVRIYPIECNPRVHTAVLLFNDTPEIVDEYLSVLGPQASLGDTPLTPRAPQKYYWVGQDVVELVLHPLYLAIFDDNYSPSELGESIKTFMEHVLYWKDGTFEMWDPWPWWWLYHVYWPVQFARYLVKRRWHKLNVSTGKIFSS